MSVLREVRITDKVGNPLSAVSPTIPALQIGLLDANGLPIEAVSPSVPALQTAMRDSVGNDLAAVSPSVPALQTALRDSAGNTLSAVSPSIDALKTATHDGAGNPIASVSGALSVTSVVLPRNIVNTQFGQDTATTTTFAVAASAGDTAITVTSAAGFAVGDSLSLNGEDTGFVKPIITDITGTVFTLNYPLNESYIIGESVTKALVNMAVTGTLATPESFTVQPITGRTWYIARILIEMTHPNAADNSYFGDLAALTNGVALRFYDGLTGSSTAFTVWQTNSDIVTDMFDVVYSSRAGGGGAYGTNARGSFTKAGVELNLNGTNGDYFEVLIQDDLSGLNTFRIKAQGYYVI